VARGSKLSRTVAFVKIRVAAMDLYATMQKLQNEIEELKVAVKDKDKLLQKLTLFEERIQTLKDENRDLRDIIQKRDKTLYDTTMQVHKRDIELQVLKQEKDLDRFEIASWKKICQDIITEFKIEFTGPRPEPACP
jgi:chromosome segregation ATPase